MEGGEMSLKRPLVSRFSYETQIGHLGHHGHHSLFVNVYIKHTSKFVWLSL